MPARLSPAARRTSRAGRLRRALLDLSQALPFLLPKTVVFGLFVLLPFGYTILLTFQEGSLLGGLTFAGLENYRSVVSDGLFRQTLVNTAVFMLICVPLTLVVTLLVGMLLSSSLPGMSAYRTLIYLPSLLSIVATGLIWKIMVDSEYGPVHALFAQGLGIEIAWLTDGTTAMVFLAMITLWSTCGFYSIIFMAGFNNIPPDVLEAARIDGASGWRLFTTIKLPLIRPVLQLVLILVTINSIQVFDLVYVLTNGGPGTATYTAMWYIYQSAFNGGSMSYAATMSIVLLLVTAVISVVFIGRTRSDGADHE
ncbi:sugar ABC transporter permease [Actinomadura viridis]|uniref:ABC-type sugar transport system permease subunit n=1 Tax=Actinomadura viridis TaxID=58110 RepID=A0A931DGE5_9ACTN|nr:sugar ABC transporter permease [Actinomadura viridis]MBG6088792.1 ABC-type sugar transport system permease subunit [Actinomadura viridis]